MGYTKRQFINEAYAELGLADYAFDLSPEQIISACRRLDAMMAEWNGRGTSLGYLLPTSPEDTNPDDETTAPDWANEAIMLNLAIRLAPGSGKAVAMETKAAAKNAYNTVLNRTVKQVEMQYPPSLPLGAGWKQTTSPFFETPVETAISGPTPSLEFEP